MGSSARSTLMYLECSNAKKTLKTRKSHNVMKMLVHQGQFFCMPTSLSGRSWSSTFRKSMSLDEMMPTNLPPILPLSVTGMPQNPWRALAWKTSLTRSLGLITTGSVMKPCSYRWRRKGRKEMRRGKNRMGMWKNKEGAKKGAVKGT